MSITPSISELLRLLSSFSLPITVTFILVLDLSGLSKKTFTVDSFKVSGLSSKYKADVTQTSMNVTVIGSEKELKSLKSSDIEGVIDTSDQSGTVGSVQMPVLSNSAVLTPVG